MLQVLKHMVKPLRRPGSIREDPEKNTKMSSILNTIFPLPASIGLSTRINIYLYTLSTCTNWTWTVIYIVSVVGEVDLDINSI